MRISLLGGSARLAGGAATTTTTTTTTSATATTTPTTTTTTSNNDNNTELTQFGISSLGRESVIIKHNKLIIITIMIFSNNH